MVAKMGVSVNAFLLLKISHTLLWVIFAAATIYILHGVCVMRCNRLFFLCLFSLIGETIAMAMNNWVCPITNIARKLTEHNAEMGFDIFLPKCIVKVNTFVFAFLFSLSIFIFIINCIIKAYLDYGG